jgi:nucleoside-diphosphate kinase
MQKTLVLIKPDGVKRNLIGDILNRYEKKGMKITAIKSVYPSRDMVEEHYYEHKSKSFFGELIDYLTEGMVVACIVEGSNSIKCVRLINGATKFSDAQPGTIRGDYACEETCNLVHASDSVESAEREAKLWFPELF